MSGEGLAASKLVAAQLGGVPAKVPSAAVVGGFHAGWHPQMDVYKGQCHEN